MVSIAEFKQAFASSGTNDPLEERVEQVRVALFRLQIAVDKAVKADGAKRPFKEAVSLLFTRLGSVREKQRAGDKPGAAAELNAVDRQFQILTTRFAEATAGATPLPTGARAVPEGAPPRPVSSKPTNTSPAPGTPPKDSGAQSETRQTDVWITSRHRTGADVRKLADVRREMITWMTKLVTEDRAAALVDASNLKDLHRRAGTEKQSYSQVLRAHLKAGKVGIDSVRFSIDKWTTVDTSAPQDYVDVFYDVFDAKTGKPIKGATIKSLSVFDATTGAPILDSESGHGTLGTFTDDEGRTHLQMRENTKKNIRISALGYEKADVTITTGTARKLEAGASRLTPLDPAQLELTKVVMGITIVDAHGHWNVPKAKVTLGSLSGVTDVDGFVNFHILPGRYKDTVIADGYLKATGELDVPESQQQEFQKIYIRPDPAMAVELTISVVDAADGKGVPDAQVNVGVTGAVTNASGVVTWQESPGTYPFSVTAKGYSRETGKITVTKAKQETFIIRRI